MSRPNYTADAIVGATGFICSSWLVSRTGRTDIWTSLFGFAGGVVLGSFLASWFARGGDPKSYWSIW